MYSKHNQQYFNTLESLNPERLLETSQSIDYHDMLKHLYNRIPNELGIPCRENAYAPEPSKVYSDKERLLLLHTISDAIDIMRKPRKNPEALVMIPRSGQGTVRAIFAIYWLYKFVN